PRQGPTHYARIGLGRPSLGCPPRPARGGPAAAEGNSTLFGATLFGLLTQKTSIYGSQVSSASGCAPNGALAKPVPAPLGHRARNEVDYSSRARSRHGIEINLSYDFGTVGRKMRCRFGLTKRSWARFGGRPSRPLERRLRIGSVR